MPDLTIALPTQSLHLNPEPPKAHVRRPLLTPIPDNPGAFLLVIDNSSLEKFVTCPMSARNYLVLGREGGAKNAALTFGGAVHAGLEQLLLGQDEVLQNDAIAKHFRDCPAPPDDYRTLQNALAILKAYRVRSTFPDYDWTILSDASGPLVERAFELPLFAVDISFNLPDGTAVTSIHVAWSGRMDAIVFCNGRARVCDHKTTSIAGDQFTQDFILSNQTLGYTWAAQQLYPEHNVSGFVLNAIHFKRPTGTSQSLTEPGPRGGAAPLSFFRAYYDYSPERVSWWVDNVKRIILDFIHHLAENSWPSHTKWCFGKYGKCPYHDACVEDNPVVRDNLLTSNLYQTVTWNPVK